MADKSAIEWTEATWTPIRARFMEIQNDGSGRERIGWHCEHASEGCRFCYAEGINRRLGTGLDFKPANLYRPEHEGYRNGESKLFLDERMLLAPLHWKRGRMIFVCSMTDLFASFVPDSFLDRIFAVMALAPQHTFQVLTKRSRRMREYMTGDPPLVRLHQAAAGDISGDTARPFNAYGNIYSLFCSVPWPLPNVWLGVSCEDQARADERIPDLLATPAAVRFISAEPLLGPIDLTDVAWPAERKRFPETDDLSDSRSALHLIEGTRLDWVIAGGESGNDARPMHPAWARALRDQCTTAGVAFFFKQWGEYRLTPAANGSEEWPAKWFGDRPPKDDEIAHMDRVGKKAAGRLLDGVEHNAMPPVQS